MKKSQRGLIWFAVIPFIMVTSSPFIGWKLGQALDKIDSDNFDRVYYQVFTQEERVRLDEVCPWPDHPLDGEIKRELMIDPKSECSLKIEELIHKHFSENEHA